MSAPDTSRRRLLGLGAAGLAGLLWPAMARAAGSAPRVLAFRNLHTGEFVRATYWAAGAYLREGLGQIDRVLRDHRTNLVHQIDRRLLSVLDSVQAGLDTAEPFEVISGYRSPVTNALLVKTTSGVAPGSLHLAGMAIDIRVPGRPLAVVRDTAKALGAGGVGYYPDSNFIHVDVGRVRYW
jgi:uncharacterized protein YcbK (DUF882 family)